jgi:DNA invertase Pin-like site-specific DNA recombinase
MTSGRSYCRTWKRPVVNRLFGKPSDRACRKPASGYEELRSIRRSPAAGRRRQAIGLGNRQGVRGCRHQRRQGSRREASSRRVAQGNANEFDLVATRSVDRLGRSLTDLLTILQHLKDKHVDLFLHQQGLDTSTTAGRAMFQMLGVFAEFERGTAVGHCASHLGRKAIPWSERAPA